MFFFLTKKKMTLLKFTRKDGEGYRSELQDYKDVRLMMDDVVTKNNGRVRDLSSMDRHNSAGDRLSAAVIEGRGASFGGSESKPYDEWEAIQHELALYTEAKNHPDDYKSTTVRSIHTPSHHCPLDSITIAQLLTE